MFPALITSTLKEAVKIGGKALVFESKDVLARLLRATSAMALLCASMETDLIHLMGCWRSGEMLQYLHVQAEPLMRKYSKLMVAHSNYKFLPHMATVPCY